MAFPQSPLPIKQELYLNGAWTDITTRTRLDGEVRITRGQTGDQAGGILATGTCAWTCNNRDYFFSNRAPASANFGKIGRNTPYRTSVTESATFLKMADYSASDGDYDGACVRTADKAVLDVTGDIDIRIDITPDNWRGGPARALMSKYLSTGNQRSWLFWIDRLGYPRFRWSSDGTTGTTVDIASTAQIPFTGRGALRVTLDVDDGAGGSVCTFYTASTISDSWTTLGSVWLIGATTSIFASTASVVVGGISSGASTIYGRAEFGFGGVGFYPYVGRVHRAQVYNGIGGTLVADMNPAGQSAGTTSWSDGLTTPNTWTTAASAEITAQDYRFWGEIGSLPTEWDVSGTDIYGQVSSYDRASRILQGAKSLHSSVYRNLIRYASTTATSGTLDGYWPMENGSQATRPAPEIGRSGSMTDAIFTTDTDFPGSAGVLSFSADTGTATGGCLVTNTASTGTVTLLFYFRAPSIPAGTVDLMRFYLAGGNSYRVTLQVSATTYNLLVDTATGTSLLSTSIGHGSGATPDQPMAMRIQLVQNGANVDYALSWYPIGAAVLYGVASSYAGTVGKPSSWTSPAFTGKTGWWISHVATLRESIDWASSSFTLSTNAYVGEHADQRFKRLCVEEGVPYWIVGWPYGGSLDIGSGSELMGPQTPQSFPALLQECARLDGGMIYGPRDKFGLTFRLYNSFAGQDCLELDYSANHLSPGFKPRDDLFFVRNDVTVTNSGGGTGHAVKTSGSLNINEPADDPNGVGTYDPGPISREAYLDERLETLAQEEVFLGTWDELRYPSVPVELSRSVFTASSTLTAAVAAVDIGKAIRITGMPAQLPPDDVELLVLGYTETLRNRGRPISWNTTPYGPYRSANNLTGTSLFRARAAATPGNSTLSSSLTSTATSFSVATASGRLWRTGSSSPTFPMPIKIGGEEMSVGQISGSSSPQTFSSVTRSVNGVIKAHSSGTEVQVRDVFYVAR